MIPRKKKHCSYHNDLCFIYKNVEGNKYCKEGYYKTFPAKKISPMSDKRKKDNKVYQTLRMVFLQSHENCEIKWEGCTGTSTEVHHTYSGKDRDKYYLDVKTWKATCRNCHNEIHNNPKEARELKLLM